MADVKQRAAAAEFAKEWAGRGYEKGESQMFWLSLLRKVFGVAEPEKLITFEDQVHLDHTSFIDGRIPSTKVLIEQKGLGKDLRAPIRQSDGSLLTPFQQAKRYVTELPVSQHPRWIVTCNFSTFLVYDMEKPNGDPEEIQLADLGKDYYRLQFLVDTGDANIQREMQVSIQAGELVGKLYDAFLNQYIDRTNEQSLKSLNMLCVRLVFCLYAEDAGIFGKHNMFHNYMMKAGAYNARRALIDLFEVLDTPLDRRDKYMVPELAAFPYVNGGLFSDENIEIPNFTDEILDLLLHKASEDFDWSAISPTIFGAVFESTLNPETRRKGGMHYTSIENIHKVINPLFLDELRQELDEILDIKVNTTRKVKLQNYQKKLAGLTFLDPACGSGNFLTETYISLRKLENEVIRSLIDAQRGQVAGQVMMGLEGSLNLIQVSIQQFYGIEINDFAVTVAKTALWIAESQMMKQTEEILHMNLDFLPLKSYANIAEGNALRLDWTEVVPEKQLNYIMGNPPFVGQPNRTPAQVDDMNLIFGKGNIETKQDYVICWYKKALEYINGKNENTIVAFVSTNSICQGESVPTFWKGMIDNGAEIIFAYPSFVWDSEASEKAHVHCVIVGFAYNKRRDTKIVYDGISSKVVRHINAYLHDAPDIWITNRTNIPKYKLPKMTTGSPPTDDGGLLLTVEEKEYFIERYPVLQEYIRPFIGAREFLHDKTGEFSRYCFWFANASPSIFANIREIRERLEKVKALREASSADRIRKMAVYPYLFCQNRQPDTSYLVIPQHSSQNRRYIPIGYVNPHVIASNACTIISGVSIYEFGILNSNVHNAWMRTVCGRIKSDIRYAPAIYNNLPRPTPTDAQKASIEKTAQAILDARALYSDCSLADLYDEVTMPPELRKAHQANDKAVMQAYGFWGKLNTESECVAALMEMYAELTKS